MLSGSDSGSESDSGNKSRLSTNVLAERHPQLGKNKFLNFSFFALLAAAVLVVILLIVLRKENDESSKVNSGKAAIVANGYECAAIGKQIFQKHGSIADVAIATLFCEGISCPQSMGLGGGFLMAIFRKEENSVEVLNARETAPAAATEDMFVANPSESSNSGKGIAIPGELKGYWELHKKYGKLDWASLIEPSIKLCRQGHVVTPYLSRILQARKQSIMAQETLSEIFVNPKTNEPWVEGDVIKRPILANTLEIIAKEGVNALYNGSLTEGLLNDIRKYNGIITKQDLLDYTPRWDTPVYTTLFNDEYKYYSVGSPASGDIVPFIINIVSGYDDKTLTSKTYHRIAEAMKFGFAKRSGIGDRSDIKPLVKNLTDPDYASYIRSLIDDNQTYNDYNHYGPFFDTPDDMGTAHISIVGPNGDAISVTSTINNPFGCKYRSQSTGIILNDEMDDFSNPQSLKNTNPTTPANFIKPGKRPLSSMAPIIILNKNNDVVLVFGGSGGKKILSASAYIILHYMLYNKTIEEALEARRLHHQFMPMVLQYEIGFNATILEVLAQKQHVLKETPNDYGFAAMICIGKKNDEFVGRYDSRRGGSKEINFVVN